MMSRRRMMMVQQEYDPPYLCIESADGRALSLNWNNSDNTLYYSTDGGIRWNSIQSGQTLSCKDKKVLFKLINPKATAGYGVGSFYIYGICRLSGNCMSMLYGDNASGQLSLSGYNYAFEGMFRSNPGILSVSDNFLPAQNLAPGCYANMFKNCANLTKGSILPASRLVVNCYYGMYAGCISLVEAPLLSNIDFAAGGCCDSMFAGCSRLRYVKTLSQQPVGSAMKNWLNGVSDDYGVLVKGSQAAWDEYAPSRWVQLFGYYNIVNSTDNEVVFYCSRGVGSLRPHTGQVASDKTLAPIADLMVRVVVSYGRDSYYTTWKAGQRLGDFQHNQYEFIEIQEVIIPEQEDYYYN